MYFSNIFGIFGINLLFDGVRGSLKLYTNDHGFIFLFLNKYLSINYITYSMGRRFLKYLVDSLMGAYYIYNQIT